MYFINRDEYYIGEFNQKEEREGKGQYLYSYGDKYEG